MNPYSHTYDQRWSDGDPTSVENLDIAREGVDHVKWILENAGIGGDGYLDADHTSGVVLVNATGNCAALLWLHSNGKVYFKSATGTTTPPTPSTENDGEEITSAQPDSTTDPGF